MSVVSFDVDSVLIDFKPAFIKKALEWGFKDIPETAELWDSWRGTDDVRAAMQRLYEDSAENRKFWSTLEVLPELDVKPSDLKVDIYITGFPLHSLYRIKNLKDLSFPDRPVICTNDKPRFINKFGVTHMIDDHWDTFVNVNNNCPNAICYLYKSVHNSKEREAAGPSPLYIDHVSQYQEIISKLQ